jgi:hypothetical protein
VGIGVGVELDTSVHVPGLLRFTPNPPPAGRVSAKSLLGMLGITLLYPLVSSSILDTNWEQLVPAEVSNASKNHDVIEPFVNENVSEEFKQSLEFDELNARSNQFIE